MTGIRWLAALWLALSFHSGFAQTPAPKPAWEFTKFFEYHIEKILVSTAGTGSWNVRVIFSVSDPTHQNGDTWNIKTALPFAPLPAPLGAGSLTINIGWDPASDFTNTGSAGASLSPLVSTTLGAGAAMPIQLRGLTGNPGAKVCTIQDCPGLLDQTNRYWVEQKVTPVAFKTTPTKGRVAIEGRPVCYGLPGCPSGPPYANIPVRSVVADFALLNTATLTSAMVQDPRRKVVDFDTKCKNCHDGIKLSGTGTPIPRLSLHGNNRTENLGLCVMCHNPNQTDVPYRVISADARTSGPETSVDFKRMIHAIHAGEFRKTPLVVIGRNTSINDYSEVRFPGKLENCLNCHVENNGKGSFELPLSPNVLGSTIATGSTYALPAGTARTVDINPANDLKITPIASTCSGCHDSSEVRSHMIRTGRASFGALQASIGTTVKERCADCHGPGKEEDVRKAHEIGRGGSDRRRRGDD